MAKREHWSKWLERMCACDEAVRWCRKHKTVGEAWRKCSNADWIEWLVGFLCWDVGVRLDLALDGYPARPWGRFYPASAGKALLPTPTLADLKAAARGEQPWELVK